MIMLSKINITIQMHHLFVLLSFWSVDSNTWRVMTPTLLDMVVILGLSTAGIESLCFS